MPLLTGRQKVILGVFFAAFAILIYGFVPWDDVMDTIFSAEWPFPTFETFYFAEASVVFIIAAVIIGLIGKLGEERTVNAIVAGAGEFLGAALIIVLARAVTVVMKNAAITDTIIHWTEDAVSGTSGTVFGAAGDDREPAHRVPGAVVIRARGADHADPRAAGRLR